MEKKKEIYKYDDNICFRKCCLAEESKINSGDCSKFYERRNNFILNIFVNERKYSCLQNGFHFYCAEHKTVELHEIMEEDNHYLECPKCGKRTKIESFNQLAGMCQEKLNIKELEVYKFIRLDDWYTPEIKNKLKDEKLTEYWIHTDIKKDKDEDTIVVIYIGHKGKKEKVQFFIKPEKKEEFEILFKKLIKLHI
jgi:hypothetical protein